MAARSDFEEWLVAREPSLQRLALLLTGDPHSAQDLVQTSLAKLYLAWDRLEDREHLDGYARRVLVNEHRSAWRRPWRRREVVTAEVPDVPTTSRSGPDVHAEVWAFVATLPPRQRAVLVLRYYEELTEAETADALGISVGTVKSQASRALAALRSRLADHPEIAHPGQEES